MNVNTKINVPEQADAVEVAAISAAVSKLLNEKSKEETDGDAVDPWLASGRYAVVAGDGSRTPHGIGDLDMWTLSGRADRF